MSRIGLGWMKNGLRARDGEKIDNRIGKQPQLDKRKMAKKWRKDGGKENKKRFSGHFWAIFCPCQARGCFPYGFAFFPFLALRALAIPCRLDISLARERLRIAHLSHVGAQLTCMIPANSLKSLGPPPEDPYLLELGV